MRAAFFGGVYSNWVALDAALRDARRRGAEVVHCLGDLGAFGPHPDRSIELLRERSVVILQGNYDDAVGNEKSDCGCGYTDPRDNHFARISYAYTFEKTSPAHRPWLAALPRRLSFEHAGLRYVLVHGSPRQQNASCGSRRLPITCSTRWRAMHLAMCSSARTPGFTGSVSYGLGGVS